VTAVIDDTPRALRARRAVRAAAARRLLGAAPDCAGTLDWDTLAQSPHWLALPEAALARFARRLGAVLCAPAVKLWIDGPRIAAARAALGDAFLQALLAEPDVPAIDAGGRARQESAERLPGLLQAGGAGVLLASLPAGPLRRAAAALLGPAVDLALTPALAHTLIARTQALAAGAANDDAAAGDALPRDAVGVPHGAVEQLS
jgi:hypothetical protein